MIKNHIRSMHVKAIKMRWLTGGVNYSYLLSTQDKTKSWLIDPAEPLEVLPELTDKEIGSIEAVVNTHHHYDHSGGNIPVIAALKKAGQNAVSVICGSHTSPGATEVPQDLQKYKLGDLEVLCIRTPCHTQDSVCYFVKDFDTGERCIFTGDTLFTAGCGRFFEGTGEEMDRALNRNLLEHTGEENWSTTKVYPGHEYTKSNVEFVRTAIYKTPGENKAFDKLEHFCDKNEVTTGCFTLKDELDFNPFMRLNCPIVRKSVGDAQGAWPKARVMDKLRQMKNHM